jgi:1-deoxy-D-xylulose-5-phosphate reductoisomerase
MKIPIFNTLYQNQFKKINSNKLNIDILNNLKLQKIDNKLFPVIDILKYLPSKSSLFETVLVATNDELVNLFLKEKITFYDISKNLLKFINLKEFQKFKKKKT